MPIFVIFARIVLSALLSGLIGLEREIHGCAAGLRTHILVCVGSALFTIASITMAMEYSHMGAVDPARIAAGIVTGIGFLGAGAIIRYGASIRGLTTAASIWAVSAIGLAVGAGIYAAAVVTTAVVLVVLVLSRFEERIALKKHIRKMNIVFLEEGGITFEDLKDVLENYGGKIRHSTSNKDGKGKLSDITLEVIIPKIHLRDVVDEITSLPGVSKVNWI